MNEIIYSQIFLLTLTVGVYLGAVQLRRRVNCAATCCTIRSTTFEAT